MLEKNDLTEYQNTSRSRDVTVSSPLQEIYVVFNVGCLLLSSITGNASHFFFIAKEKVLCSAELSSAAEGCWKDLGPQPESSDEPAEMLLRGCCTVEKHAVV